MSELRNRVQGLTLIGFALAITAPDSLTATDVICGAPWTAESDLGNAQFGWEVASAGDVNGDGYSDVIVGAYAVSNGHSMEGRAYVYLGTPNGLESTPVWTAEGEQTGAFFGWSVGTAGDVNGDGYSDIIVGSVRYDGGENDEGRAFVFHGSPSGPSLVADWTGESDQESAFYGDSVATAGDVNGDGFSDVIVGAIGYDGGNAGEGRAYVYLGSASGLASNAAWTTEADQDGAELGSSVCAAGDVNGDGFGDVIVGAQKYDGGEADEGRAFVFHGSPGGLSLNADWTGESGQIGGNFGRSVSTAGDVNGDGYADIVVGAYLYDLGSFSEGRVYVYYGSAFGLSTNADWTADGQQEDGRFGRAVSTAGDVNADGYSDLLVGAHVHDVMELDEGCAFVFLGGAGGLEAEAAWTGSGEQEDARFGKSVATAGDVDGDGYGDLIVGAYRYDEGENNEGRAFVFHGCAGGPSPIASWSAEGDQMDALFGEALSRAGDINGDGYGDALVGAFQYDGGEQDEGRAMLFEGSPNGLSATPAWTAESDQDAACYARAVANAGDVNGDGYDDVIVGAYRYNGPDLNEGRAYVYAGSASGLSASPSWILEGNQPGAYFGRSVGSAGDVNGDGYGDVLVGTPGYDEGQSDEGRVDLYLGSAGGLRTTSVWSTQGDQDIAWYGWAVAAAGDVNADGYGDVLVSSVRFDAGEVDEGRAYLFLGSRAGLSATPDWTAEGDQIGAGFGQAVAGAGDVDRDGYSDVIVGAIRYDAGEVDEGRAYLYRGSAAGLSNTPSWTAEGDQSSANFGRSVSAAGDVNGDGYSDVIVGAENYSDGEAGEGRAYVYFGSPAGLSTAAGWTAEPDQVGAKFGIAVSGAADFDGDGYDDVLVGGAEYDGGEMDEGGAWAYHGNEGRGGLSRALQQRRADDAAPIALHGRSDSSSQFRLSVELPHGQAGFQWASPVEPTAFLEWEVKPVGAAFDGSGFERSAIGQPLDPFGGPLSFDELISPAGGTKEPFRWRARVVFEGSPLASHTPWFSFPGNAPNESKLRLPTGPFYPVR